MAIISMPLLVICPRKVLGAYRLPLPSMVHNGLSGAVCVCVCVWGGVCVFVCVVCVCVVWLLLCVLDCAAFTVPPGQPEPACLPHVVTVHGETPAVLSVAHRH